MNEKDFEQLIKLFIVTKRAEIDLLLKCSDDYMGDFFSFPFLLGGGGGGAGGC